MIGVDESHRGEIPILVGSVGDLHLLTLRCEVAVSALNHLTVVTKLEKKMSDSCNALQYVCNICIVNADHCTMT